ncbi:hypothetical protein NMY3_03208 [Candidatus Nitrosocosmicus oleophilus]|uniref:Uncharacterized protein n=1 Tax=Candidatus Nitrosocosmicus oleophilus TaxID=1353260 RepID=A0A654M3X9_9ARCH|nr:hypothetical protein [Candidatus Nitrosocosmicus oleophilus]ALI37393.1 hypothetical protein NMY3_03208 [Candidatus Nitrosocosmicus oleophilus]
MTRLVSYKREVEFYALLDSIDTNFQVAFLLGKLVSKDSNSPLGAENSQAVTKWY